MKTASDTRSRIRGGVIGLSLGKYAFVGGGVLTVFAGVALAGPEGEQVVRGSATFTRNGPNTIIEASHNAIINYSQFNIGRHESVQFIQPSATSRVLNRINGGMPTAIEGSLTANGIVYLVNPAGIMFGKDSVINVGGIYAAAGNISDANFLNNVDHFTNVQGSVVNHGTINAGVAHLIGRQVANSGVILTDDAMTMVAGDDVYIGRHHDRIMVKVSADPSADAQAQAVGVSNSGTIKGRRVSMAAGDMYSLAIRNTGRVSARDIQVRAEGAGKVQVSGTLDASAAAPGQTGGRVEVLGGEVTLDRAVVDASGAAGGGTVLVGGDFQGRGDTPTASRTVVGSGTTIRADATQAGDGGTVIVWSDDRTAYAGHISARGAQGGSGGFAEVSGKETLVFRGTADLGSDAGRGGSLLLDPRNIVIANAGAGTIDDADAFGDGVGTDVTIAPSTITTVTNTGTSVTLQASQDITVADAIVTDNPGGDGGDLTLQAGRSIFINADIFTDNGNLTLIANETAGAGVVDDDRGAGDAVISQAAGATIDTGTGNLQITLSTGAGLTNFGSGNITLGTINAGDMLVVNQGPTAGSGIQRADAGSLITAASAAFEVSGSGGGGAIGSAASPLRLAVANVEASSQGGGVFLDSPTQGLNIGGAALGGLTGIATTDNGEISVTAQGGVTSTEAITGAGAVTIRAKDGVNLGGDLESASATVLDTDTDGDGNGGLGVEDGFAIRTNGNTLAISGFNINLNTTGAIDTGAAATTITGTHNASVGLGDAAGDMQISGSELQRITTGDLTITSSGDFAVDNVTAANSANIGGTLSLVATGSGSTITFLNAPSEFGALTARAADGIDVQVNLTTGGAAAFDADADGDGTGQFAMSASATLDSSGHSIEIIAASLAIDPDAAIVSGAGDVVLAPKSASAPIGMEDAAQAFNVTGGALRAIDSVGIVYIGRAGGAHALTIGNDNPISLLGTGYDLLLRGGDVTFTNNGITGRDNGIINFVTGSVTGLAAGTSVTIGGGAGDLRFNTTGDVTQMRTAVGRLGPGSVGGSLSIVNDGALELDAYAIGGNLTVVAGGSITDSGALAVTGAASFTTRSDAAADITLDEAGHSFAALLLDVRNAAGDDNGTGNISVLESGQMDVSLVRTGGNVSLRSGGAMNIANVSADGTGSFIAGGDINDTGTITVAGATTFKTLNNAGAAITLNNTASRFGALTLQSRNAADTADASGDITVFENAAMDLASVRTTGSARLEAAGAITDSGTLTIGGAATFRTLSNDGADITLDDPSSTFGPLTVESRNAANTADMGGSIVVFENGPMNLASVRTTGSASLSAAGAITDSGVLVIGGAASFRTLNDAGANITLDEIGSTFGQLTVQSRNQADDADAAGVIDIRESSTMDVALVSTTGSVTLRAPDINIGVGGISAGSSFVTLRPLDPAAAIAINDASGAFSLTAAELARINTTGVVNLGANGGAGAVAIGSLGAIDLSATTYDLNIRGGATTFSNSLTLGDGATLTMTTGAITSAGAGLDVAIGGMGTLILNTTGAVGSAANPFATSVASLGASNVGGDLYLDNGAAALTIGGALNAGGNAVTISTDEIEVASTITAGAITLQPSSAGTTIGLNDASGDFNLTSAELANLNTAGPVVIGREGGAGAIFIGSQGPLNLSSKAYDLTIRGGDLTFADTLTLRDNGILRLFTGAVTSAGAGLDVVIGGDGSLLLDTTGAIGSAVNPLATDIANFAARTSTGGVYVADVSGLTIASIGGVAGVDAAGAVVIFVAAGNLDTEAGATIAGSSVALAAGAGKIGGAGAVATRTGMLIAAADTGIDIANTNATLTATLNSNSGMARLTTTGQLFSGGAWSADTIDLSATGLILTHALTSTGETAIRRSSAGTIGVGDGAGDMVVSGSELQLITAGSLTIGGANTTAVTVDGVTNADTANIAGLVTLDAGEITFSGAASTFGSLQADAAGPIVVAADLSTHAGGLALTGGSIAFSGGRTVESLGDMTLTAGGGIQSQGDLVLRAAGATSDLSVKSAMDVDGALTIGAGRNVMIAADTSSTGAAAIRADLTGGGTGTITIASGVTLSTADAGITLSADGLVLDGWVNSGSAATTIRRSAAGTIGVGDGAGDLSLSRDELARITAASLDVGGTNTTGIDVSGVTLDDLANIRGLVRLDAGGAGGVVQFGGSTSVFRSLEVAAVDGVSVNASVATAAGGSLTINADADGAGAGTLSVANGASITASGGPISITAADLALDGMLNADSVAIAVSNNNDITLGGSTAPVVGRMTISDAEFGRINARTLSLGDAAAGGSITVEAITTGRSDTAPDSVTLNATRNGSHVDINGDLLVKGLTIRSNNGIVVGGNIDASGDLSLNGDTDNFIDSVDGITIAAGRTLTSGGLMTLASTTGGIVATGNITLSAADLELVDALHAAGYTVTISRSTKGTIGLGTAEGDMTITGEELARITAGDLVLGGDTTTLITVSGVSAEDSDKISGVLRLDALADAGKIRFEDGASTFNALEANANDGILVAARITTDVGRLALDGDADGEAGSDDRVTLEEGVNLTSAGGLSVLAQTGGILLTGGERSENVLTAQGDQDVTLGNVTATNGASLSIFAQRSVTLGSVNLVSETASGDLAVQADANSNNAGATLTIGGRVTAGNISLAAGNDGNDTIELGGNVVAGGSLTISDAENVRLAAGVNLHSARSLNIASGVTGITLTGGADTENIIRGAYAGGDGAQVALAPISSTGAADLTILSGGDLTLAGANVGAGDLVITVDEGNRGTHTGTIGALTAGSVVVSAPGGNDTLTFSGRIQASGPGGVDLNAGAILLGGDIVAQAGPVDLQGAIVINAGLTIDTEGGDGDVTFLGPVNGGNTLTVNAGDGVVRFEGAVGGTTAVRGIDLDAAGVEFVSTVNTGVDGLNVDADSITLRGDVAAVGSVNFNGQVVLGGNLAVTGANVTFASTVDSDTQTRSLNVGTTENGVITFRGVVGGTRPLGSLTTRTVGSGGTTRLNEDIFTTSGMIFANAVVLTSDILLRDDGPGVFFGSTINSDAATSLRSLDIVVNRTGADPIAESIPVISFGGDVGNAVPLANLRLNATEATRVVGVPATIVARPLTATGQLVDVADIPANFGVRINVHDSFVMGQNEKFVSLGSLAINVADSGGVARLGDLAAVGDLSVSAPSIVLQLRDSGPIRDVFSTQIISDTGLDFIGRTISFSTTPVVEGVGGPVTFGTESGVADTAGTLGGFLFRKFGEISRQQMVFNNAVVDVRSAGPSNTNIATTIAGAIPRDTQSGDVSQDTTVGQAQRDELTQLGVFARGLGLDELLTFLVGRSIYDDYPDRPNPSEQAGDYKVAVNRLDAKRVAELLRAYDRVFNRDAVDAEGNPVFSESGARLRQPRTEEISESLQRAYQDYRGTGPNRREFDPVAFYAFLEESPEHAEALAHINGIREVFRQLSLIGLTPQEFNIAKQTLLKDVRPGILRREQLESLVLPQPAGVS